MKKKKTYEETDTEMINRWLKEHRQEIAKHNQNVKEIIDTVEKMKKKLTNQVVDVIKANEKVRWDNEKDKKFNLQSNVVLEKVNTDFDWVKTDLEKIIVKVYDYNHDTVEAHNICTEAEE